MALSCRYCHRRPATRHRLLAVLAWPLAGFGGSPAGFRACRDCGAGLLALTLIAYAALAAALLVLAVIAT